MAKEASSSSPERSHETLPNVGKPANEFGPTSTATNKKKTTKAKNGNSTASLQSNSLVICRNKHWRFISSFHGPWLQLPIEILEIIANMNYNAPRPRPVDAATLFDALKVRKGVDEATTLAVRAANDLASSALTNVHGGMGGSHLNSLGMTGPGHGAKLSRERKHRMRELACQRLAKAYRLDEIACSVATMQSASALEEVGGLVLQRNSQDPDANYVHFFHEKIPSRQLVETTSLQPLTDIIESGCSPAEILRTRATVKVFKEDFEGAAQDLTEALNLSRYRGPTTHKVIGDQDDLTVQMVRSRNGKKQQDIILQEDEQPSGLGAQLFFHRASAYLTMACRLVESSIPPSTSQKSADSSTDTLHNTASRGENGDGGTPDATREQVESRKLVKTLAKRALKDYMSFVGHFDYSPNLPEGTVADFNERVSMVANGHRKTRTLEPSSPLAGHTVYSLTELFSATPPSDLPPYPAYEVAVRNSSGTSTSSGTCELVTYHPLLTDALHAILLCHCLVQTSVKELQRHAYMVARLVRLSDGYPIFHASRSPARADWVEIVRRAKNWLNLSASWESLCAPAPMAQNQNGSKGERDSSSALAAASLLNGGSVDSSAKEKGGSLSPGQTTLDAAPPNNLQSDHAVSSAVTVESSQAASSVSSGNGKSQTPQWWTSEETKEYPFLTERAAAIARWIRDAPIVTGTAKRKKRSKKPGSSKVDALEPGLENMDLEGLPTV